MEFSYISFGDVMKRVLCVLLCTLIFPFMNNTTACATEFSVSAQAYVLYCVESDSVILGENYDVKMKPASTTKIMTTLLALEQCKKRDIPVKFTEDMIAEGSSMYLEKGDVVHLSSLAKGMMMASGNDAANAVALTLSDSIEDFSSLMNKRAKELRMENTHFVTPSGLDDENHYTTALDMSKLMAHAMKNEAFRDITKNKSMTVSFIKPKKQVTYENHNRLLSLYEYCTGGKTGYTKSAGRCLVSVAKKDGVTLVCVTFNASDDWNDHTKLYDYGFDRLRAVDTSDTACNFSVDVVGADGDTIPLYCKSSDTAVVEKDDLKNVTRYVYLPQFLYAPIKKDEYVGMVVYKLGGEIIAQNPIYTKASANQAEHHSIKGFLEKIFR